MEFSSFLHGLNIPLIDDKREKTLGDGLNNNPRNLLDLIDIVYEQGRDRALGKVLSIEGIGPKEANSIVKWCEDVANNAEKRIEFYNHLKSLDLGKPY